MPAPTASTSARAYATENGLKVTTVSPVARAYATESMLRAVSRSASATAYLTEKTSRVPLASPNAGTYSTERTLPADPNELYVWDASLGEYVRVPWYVYNTTTDQWQQVT